MLVLPLHYQILNLATTEVRATTTLLSVGFMRESAIIVARKVISLPFDAAYQTNYTYLPILSKKLPGKPHKPKLGTQWATEEGSETTQIASFHSTLQIPTEWKMKVDIGNIVYLI